MNSDTSAPTRPAGVNTVQKRTGFPGIIEGQAIAVLSGAEGLQQRINAHIAASDAFIARHGTLAEEFGTI